MLRQLCGYRSLHFILLRAFCTFTASYLCAPPAWAAHCLAYLAITTFALPLRACTSLLCPTVSATRAACPCLLRCAACPDLGFSSTGF